MVRDDSGANVTLPHNASYATPCPVGIMAGLAVCSIAMLRSMHVALDVLALTLNFHTCTPNAMLCGTGMAAGRAAVGEKRRKVIARERDVLCKLPRGATSLWRHTKAGYIACMGERCADMLRDLTADVSVTRLCMLPQLAVEMYVVSSIRLFHFRHRCCTWLCQPVDDLWILCM